MIDFKPTRSIILLFLYITVSFGCVASEFTWIEKGPLLHERQVFLKSFVEAYKDIPLEILNIGQPSSKHNTLEEFLNALMDEDDSDLAEKKPNTYYIHAKDESGMVIGYASFDVNDAMESYIRYLAVDPSTQHKGIGKRLVYSIIEMFPQISRISLVTRKANLKAINFYKHIGFCESNDQHDGFDSILYMGLEKTF